MLTCEYGPCVLEETIGFNISEGDIGSLLEQYAQNRNATLNFRLKLDTSFDWNDNLPVVEIAGLMQAIDTWKKAKGLAIDQ